MSTESLNKNKHLIFIIKSLFTNSLLGNMKTSLINLSKNLISKLIVSIRSSSSASSSSSSFIREFPCRCTRIQFAERERNFN
jgi:hypothetical protein